MGKLRNSIYCYLIADIMTKGLGKCLLTGPLPNIYFLFKPPNLTGCHGNQNAKFPNNTKKSTFKKLYEG